MNSAATLLPSSSTAELFEDQGAVEITDELVRLHLDLGAVTGYRHEVDAMQSAVQDALMRVRLGQIARAGAVVDSLRANLHRVGL